MLKRKIVEEESSANKKLKITDDWLFEMIPESWKSILETEWKKPYMKTLSSTLDQEYKEKVIFPPKENIFESLKLCEPDTVKIVIVGQDPYHGRGQAHGLSFSVKEPTKPPPSLVNIYKEIKNEYPNFAIPKSGDLTDWAKQGVLLLNATLTVREKTPNSHKDLGWTLFTDAILRYLNNRKNKPIVFMLWGKFAQEKCKFIAAPHLILKCAHPSPYSADHGFFGCDHFKKANAFLKDAKVDWFK